MIIFSLLYHQSLVLLMILTQKFKEAVLRQKQNWNAPQIKNFGAPEEILRKINITYSLGFSGSYKKSLVTTPPPISLSLHCKQINNCKSEMDGQPSSLLACMYFLIVFLELGIGHCHLDLKLLDENNNAITPRTFHLQLSSK